MSNHKPSQSLSAKTVTDKTFQTDIIEAKGLILLDFWATWCAPCRALAPKLDEVYKQLSDKFTLAKMNIEESPKTPSLCGVRGIPTLILFKDGKQIDQLVGNHSKEDIKAFIEKHLD